MSSPTWATGHRASQVSDPLLLLAAYLPLSDLRALRLCSSECNTSVQSFLAEKLIALLSSFVSEPIRFRDVIRKTQSIICGSAALEFVLHGTGVSSTHPADLDICTSSVHAITVIRHLRVVEGYHVLPLDRPDTYDMIYDYRPGVVSSTRLVHDTKGRIDVACSTRLVASHPLAYTPHTLLMNYLTADGLVVAYPSWMFKGTGVNTNSLPASRSALDYQAKIVSWGWPGLPHRTGATGPEDAKEFNLSRDVRSFDDEQCFRMSFTSAITASDLPRLPSTAWMIQEFAGWDRRDLEHLSCVIPSTLYSEHVPSLERYG